MKKIFQKIVLSVLCCALVLGAAGCADDERTGGTIDVKLDEYHYEGTHVYNVKPTGKTAFILSYIPRIAENSS